MAELQVNSKELMYLCALAGAQEIYGIPDGFHGIAKEKIPSEIEKISSDLMDRGYLEMDFDGNIAFSAGATKIVRTIANCQRTLTVHSIIDSEVQNPYIFYNDGSMTVKACSTEKGYLISEILPNLLCTDLTSQLNSKNQSSDFCKITNEIYENAKNLVENKKNAEAVALLAENGLSEEVANLLVNAFSKKTSFLSAVFSNVRIDEAKTEGIIVVYNENTAIDITPILDDTVEYIEIKTISLAQEKERLNYLLASYGFAE